MKWELSAPLTMVTAEFLFMFNIIYLTKHKEGRT